ncbi:unnamed protein product [Acanthoscelides obtectus]|uniref:Uncharacterized protein n=1 Tax=Acanthoscelides obtectus TaxID=200917 RepID=A0A9P0L3J8_ACAOB|nr:unnamed protein product [Acanthoscelides obtectus]CAK1680925.1 hypothetical protein AOBTE_LOCUS32943 [Acanthoscelides obtectus]
MEVIFGVAGHSFIPPDRVFARIEKVIKKKETIVSPDEFRNIFKDRGTVFILGKDVKVYDWKKDSQNSIKPPAQWHFRFNMSKRFLFRKGRNKVGTVRGVQSYKTDLGEYKSVFKKGQTVSSIIQSKVPDGVMPNQAKLNDVKVLIEKHWDKEWHALENLQYYSEVLKKYM